MTTEPSRPPSLELHPDEQMEFWTWVDGAVVAVTDKRVVVGTAHRQTVNLLIDHVSRVTLTVEQGRRALLMIVPTAQREAVTLEVPTDGLAQATRLMYVIGHRLQLLPRG